MVFLQTKRPWIFHQTLSNIGMIEILIKDLVILSWHDSEISRDVSKAIKPILNIRNNKLNIKHRELQWTSQNTNSFPKF